MESKLDINESTRFLCVVSILTMIGKKKKYAINCPYLEGKADSQNILDCVMLEIVAEDSRSVMSGVSKVAGLLQEISDMELAGNISCNIEYASPGACRGSIRVYWRGSTVVMLLVNIRVGSLKGVRLTKAGYRYIDG